jgi:hypothetical protein
VEKHASQTMEAVIDLTRGVIDLTREEQPEVSPASTHTLAHAEKKRKTEVSPANTHTHIDQNLNRGPVRRKEVEPVGDTSGCDCCKDGCDPNGGCPTAQCNTECAPGNPWCANQRISQNDTARTEVRDTGEQRNFGLFASECIALFTFVIQYVGVMIAQQPHSTYAVAMHGTPPRWIDAKKCGNDARYANHSCDPNCRMEQWTVQGTQVLVLIAIKPINKGDEITFDYNWKRTPGSPEQTCHCGASICKGVL